ncbi:MAG: phosphoadenosine phosphosulfate reductase family protein, partial [Gammaproteobacteria bacterium]|nr:phosphoadenosine phosphosulfate reductase family protein [Gammaproteobacteria bacterium]
MTLESRLLEQLSSSLQLLHEPVDRLVLAFSGGLDSCVLLHLLSLYPAKFKVLTWHVNHGLLENAGEMENFCQSVASQYNFEFMVSRLHLN